MCIMRNFEICNSSTNTIRFLGQGAQDGKYGPSLRDATGTDRTLVVKPEGRRPLGIRAVD
jgi:hypothetical protein